MIPAEYLDTIRDMTKDIYECDTLALGQPTDSFTKITDSAHPKRYVRFVAVGTHAALIKKRNGLYKKLWQQQNLI